MFFRSCPPLSTQQKSGGIQVSMASEDDYDVYQYSDEDGYSVEDDEEMPDSDHLENPNAPPVHYNKVGRCLSRREK